MHQCSSFFPALPSTVFLPAPTPAQAVPLPRTMDSSKVVAIRVRFVVFNWLHSKILGIRMVDDDRAGGFLRPQLILVSQYHIDPMRFQQIQDFILIMQVGAGWIAERITAAAIMLLDESGN